jgi:hypothetical protein
MLGLQAYATKPTYKVCFSTECIYWPPTAHWQKLLITINRFSRTVLTNLLTLRGDIHNQLLEHEHDAKKIKQKHARMSYLVIRNYKGHV